MAADSPENFKFPDFMDKEYQIVKELGVGAYGTKIITIGTV